jgi:hypothetical protein
MIIIVYFTADIIFERIFICGYCVFRSTIVFMYTYIAYRYTIVLTFINNNWYFRYYITFFELKFPWWYSYIILYCTGCRRQFDEKLKREYCVHVYTCVLYYIIQNCYDIYVYVLYRAVCVRLVSSHHTHTHTHTYTSYIFFLCRNVCSKPFSTQTDGSIIKSILSSQVVRTAYMFIYMCVCVDL